MTRPEGKLLSNLTPTSFKARASAGCRTVHSSFTFAVYAGKEDVRGRRHLTPQIKHLRLDDFDTELAIKELVESGLWLATMMAFTSTAGSNGTRRAELSDKRRHAGNRGNHKRYEHDEKAESVRRIARLALKRGYFAEQGRPKLAPIRKRVANGRQRNS